MRPPGDPVFHAREGLTLTTPRLLLRPLELADAAQAQILFPRWEIVRYVKAAVPWPYPPDGAVTYYRDVALPAMERGEAWHWSLRLREAPDQLVGSVTLRRGERENRGFWIGLPWQRLGLATEACAAMNEFWFETLGFAALRVSKAAANEPSRRISQSEGMRLVATEEHAFVSGRLPAEVWELTAGEWRTRRLLGPCPPRLRPASPTDREFLHSTRKAALRPHVEAVWAWDEERQRAAAEREFAELPVQIIESGALAIGYLRVVHRAAHDFLDEIALLPRWQGHGVGTSLLRRVMNDAAGRGVPLRLSVLAGNPARRLYERLGFRVASIEHPRVMMEWIASS